MNSMMGIFVASAQWLEYGVALGLAALLGATILRRGALAVMTIRMWWVIALAWSTFFAMVLTVAQYRMWQANDITRELITTPLGPEIPRMLIHVPVAPFLEGYGGYYVFYAYTHFWLPLILACIGTLVVYGIFRFLKHYKPVAVGYEEVFMVSGVAFLVGWPNMIVFVALAFVFTFLHAVYTHVRLGAMARTRMLSSIIVAALGTLFFSATIAAYTATLAL